ncbi:MAG TPA: pilin [Candidatus Saccharimonadales bacterium]|jgi:hypothetical protein
MLSTYLLTTFAASCNSTGFFGLKPWYHYLETDGNCNIVNFNVLDPKGTSDVLLILLALTDDLLRISGLVAIAFVIYGGIQYLTSEGSPDATQRAQNTIKNSLVGLVIAMLAVAAISFIGNRIGDA